MRYLFGDSTTFPLNHNFLETLAAGIDTAVALLYVDEALERSRRVTEEANTTALTELCDIDRYSERIAHALGDREGVSTATTKVVSGVADMAARELDRARSAVKAWRESTIRQAQQGCGADALMLPLDRFMVRHDLPFTTWGLRWRAGHGDEPVQAQAYAVMQRGLSATLAIDIPKKHLWSEPLRVGELEKKLTIQLMGKTMFGRETLKDEHLDRYFISRVTYTTEREAFILSKRAKEPSPGLRVSMREGVQQRILIGRIDDNEVPLGEPVALEGLDAVMIKRLWGRIQETILELVYCRAQLVSATIHGKPVSEIESPATVAITFIQSLAPLSREMLKHSRASGELQLKRDLGDGRREELFVGKKDLIAKYGRLSQRNRELFAVLGLERRADESIDESNARGARPSARGSRPSRPSRRKAQEGPPPSDVYETEALTAAYVEFTTGDSPTPIARLDQLPLPSLPPQHGTAALTPLPPVEPISSLPPTRAHQLYDSVPPAPAQPLYDLPPPSIPPRRPQLRVVSGG